MAKKKFILGKLTEDDWDEDYEPGRSEPTMTSEHKSRLDSMADEIKAKAAEVGRKRTKRRPLKRR